MSGLNRGVAGGSIVRPLLVGVHKWIGLAIAGFLVIAGLTGSVIAFQAELDAALNPDFFKVAVPRKRLALEILTAKAEAALPYMTIETIDLSSDPSDTVRMFVAPRKAASAPGYDQIFVDPGSGAIVGKRLWGAIGLDRTHLIPMLHRLHYSLFLPGSLGKTVMGSVAIAWMIQSMVGIYLTLPRASPFWRTWRPNWQIKPRTERYRRNLDLHRVTGLWLWPIFLLMALTGMSLALEAQVFRPVISAMFATTPLPVVGFAAKEPGARKLDFGGAFERATAVAQDQDWPKPTSTRIAHRGSLFFVRSERRHSAGLTSSEVILDTTTGNVVRARAVTDEPAGDSVMDARLTVHSGRIGGVPGRLLISITGLAVAILSITGIVISQIKRRARIKGSRRRSGQRQEME